MSKTITTVVRSVTAIALLGIGAFGSCKLLTSGKVGEWTFCFLIAASVFVFAVIWIGAALDFLKIFNIELKLREMKASEDTVKRLSVLIADYAKASLDGAYVGLTDEANAEVRRCIAEIKKIPA